jgi:hypothetical protein
MLTKRFVLAAAIFLFFETAASAIVAQTKSPLTPLAGRWTGEGRLGLKDSPPETVKCRATYIAVENQDAMKQTIRCATAGGSIEVISTLANAAGQLTGEWKETTRNLSGTLTGTADDKGLQIAVRGDGLSANMGVLVKGDRQIVEIQFIDSALIGLTLMMVKG